jgi:hypothetical protein
LPGRSKDGPALPARFLLGGGFGGRAFSAGVSLAMREPSAAVAVGVTTGPEAGATDGA